MRACALRVPLLVALASGGAWVLAPIVPAEATPFGALATADSPLLSTAPTVLSIKPKDGPEAGGTHVAISGTGFKGATEVHFGSTSATITKVGENNIKATAPAGTGTVDVTVTTPEGTSALRPPDQFTYVAPGPIVDEVSPSSGHEKGGTKVTIKGTGFTGATEVHFGPADVTRLEVGDRGTEIHLVAPPITAVGKETVDVIVTTPEGSSPITPADQYSYRVSAPVLSTVAPKQGLAAGGELLHLTGEHFVEVTAIHFGSASAPEFTVSSLGSITVVAPAETVGKVLVTVTTPFGTSSPGMCTIFNEEDEPRLIPCPPYDRFKVVEPTITGISPNVGPTAGGTPVTITGTGFAVGMTTTFEFKKTPAPSVDCISITTCEVITPAHSAGTVNVMGTVHIPIPKNRTASTPADHFTYE